MEGVKLGIGIPLSWPFFPSDFFQAFTMLHFPKGTEVIFSRSGPVDSMRNDIVQRAIMLGCTHLLFLDADMYFPPNTVQRMLAANKDIIGGLCFKKLPPFDPVLFTGEPYSMTTYYDYPEDEVIEVPATGGACLLINLEVMSEVDFPWFHFGQNKQGKTMGEDIYFCYKAAEKGFKVFVDTGLKIEHLTQVRVGEAIHRFHRWAIEQGASIFEAEGFSAE